MDKVSSSIRIVLDWPISGVNFLDITTVLEDKEMFSSVIDKMSELIEHLKIDKIIGIEARGFIFASALAYKLKTGLVLARKKGKLPSNTISRDYGLEYGQSILEVHEDSIKAGEKILVVDDVLATGGTAKAACELTGRLGGKMVGALFFIEIPSLNGEEKLDGINCMSLLKK
jgi:adenine phosphoribosyltransferase